MMKDDSKLPMAMSTDEVKTMAASVAEQMRGAAKGPLPPDVRSRFITVRAALFQRGVFDPILARFDSATVPPASSAEIADELAKLAAAL